MRLIIILSFITFFGISSNGQSVVSYKIEMQDLSYKPVKASFDIRIAKQLSRDEIKKIADDIKSKNPGFERYFIFYWLPDMIIGSGAWATSHFTPNLSINIQGVSEAKEKEMKASSVPTGEIIGKWYDNRPLVESTIIIYKAKGAIKVRQIYPDGSFGDKNLKQTGTKFTYPNDFGEFFKIESNGTLGWYSSNGKFATATVIK